MRSLLGRFHRPMSRGLVNNMLTMNNLGDGSTLSLDFTTMGGVLDPRLTFTRASTVATYINSSGYVATATTNEPRFDYSPTNIGEPRGLLIEAAATNLFSYSEDFSHGSWLKSNATASTNATTAPDGNATADYMLETAGTSTRFFAKDSGSPGTSTEIRTFSVYVKVLGRQWVSLCAGTTSGGPYYRITADLSAGTISSTDLVNSGTWFTTTPTNSISPAGPAGSGWYRITITSRWCQYYLICPSNTASPSNSGSNFGLGSAYLGDTNSGVILWGAQLELGSGASSYIPTGASQVTRTADLCSMTGTNFSSWYTQGIGTVCWSGSAFRITAGHLANINTVNNDPRITAYVGAGSLTNLVTNGTIQVSMYFGSVTANTAFKAAWRFKTNDFAACLNAGTVYTDNLGTVPTGVDRMQLGAAEGGYQFLDGWIKSIKYYPTALPDAQLKTLTAP